MTMLDTAVNQLDVVNTDLLDVQFVDHGKNSVLRLLVEISIDVFNMQEPYFIIPYLKRFWTPSVTHSHYQHWIELRNEPYLGVAVEGTGNLSENQHKYSVQRVASALAFWGDKPWFKESVNPVALAYEMIQVERLRFQAEPLPIISRKLAIVFGDQMRLPRPDLPLDKNRKDYNSYVRFFHDRAMQIRRNEQMDPFPEISTSVGTLPADSD